MSTDAMVVVAGVVAAFAAFALALAWASFHTRNFRAPTANE